MFAAAEFCPAVWDAWSCFPQTPVNTIQTLPCSSQAYQSPDKVCTCKWKTDNPINSSNRISHSRKREKLRMELNKSACWMEPTNGLLQLCHCLHLPGQIQLSRFRFVCLYRLLIASNCDLHGHSGLPGQQQSDPAPQPADLHRDQKCPHDYGQKNCHYWRSTIAYSQQPGDGQ